MPSTANAVVAKLLNQAGYEDGQADEALMPGQGCVLYENADGEQRVRSANADEQTTRVVREPRNPPRGLGVQGESPLEQGYDAEETVETVLFHSGDQARLRAGSANSAAEGGSVGWDDNAEASDTQSDGTTAVAEDIGYIRELDTETSTNFDLVTVEFA